MIATAFISCSNKEEAKKIATAAVTQGLAACGRIIPEIESIYIWEETLQNESESLLLLKTQTKHLEKLEALVMELHSYEVPGFLAFQGVHCQDSYAQWVKNNTKVSDKN